MRAEAPDIVDMLFVHGMPIEDIKACIADLRKSGALEDINAYMADPRKSRTLEDINAYMADLRKSGSDSTPG